MELHEEQIMRAEQANQVLHNPLFERAFLDTRAGILEAWAKLDPTAASKSAFADELHSMLRVMDKVRFCLVEHINTGRLAQERLRPERRNIFSKWK
jgi:hypothetical protein